MSVEGREGPETLTTIVDDYRNFTVAEALTEPDGEIFDFRLPPAAAMGDDVTPGVGIRNNGGQTGTFKLEIKDIETQETVFTGSKTLEGGATGWIYPGTKPMPGKNWKLQAQIRHNTAWDDYLQKTIPLMEAKGTITAYNAPTSTLPGETVTVTATAKNTGSGSGSFRLRLRDRDEGTEVDSTGWFTLAAGASTTKNLSGTMPGHDWRLTLLLERTLPTAAVTVDDQRNFLTVNIDNRLATLKAWWNSLAAWQKALIIGGTAGGIVAGGATLKRR